MLIDVAISVDRHVIKKEAEKTVRYKDLIKEIQRMWNVKAKVIPVITGATGTILKPLKKYPNNIPGKQEIKEIQKNSRTRLCTRTSVTTTVKVQNIFHVRNNITV